ncbi:HSP20-like chaperone [Infundibulicybe gibba]|nr:HSP20-like chaperone [Infundibulicybe gibba]
MSLARQFFRLFDELPSHAVRNSMAPLRAYPRPFDFPSRVFEDLASAVQADVAETGDTYVIEADLPGVKRDDLTVRVGDAGRSVTIEGRRKRGVDQDGTGESRSTSSHDEKQVVSNERHAMNTSFTRTFWLPRPVDTGRISAKLDDGVLTITAGKADDKENVKVDVE